MAFTHYNNRYNADHETLHATLQAQEAIKDLHKTLQGLDPKLVPQYNTALNIFTVINSKDTETQTIKKLFADRSYTQWEFKVLDKPDHTGAARIKLLERPNRAAFIAQSRLGQRPAVNPQDALMQALTAKDEELALNLLEAVPNSMLGLPDKDGKTALFLACELGLHLFATTIITRINETSRTQKSCFTARYNGSSPLDIVISQKESELALYFINELKNEELNQKGRDGKTALIAASELGLEDVVRNLLSAGANPTLKDDAGKSALDYAKANKHVEIEALLVLESFNTFNPETDSEKFAMIPFERLSPAVLNAQNSKGKTFLHIACENGFVEVVRLLIDNCASAAIFDHAGLSALQQALKKNQLAAAAIVIQKATREELNATNSNYLTALNLAASLGLVDSVESLLNRGADVCFNTDSSAFNVALMRMPINKKIVTLLIDKATPKELNGHNSNGYTLLHLAVHYNLFDVIENMILMGADPALRTHPTGRNRQTTSSPLDLAITRRYIEIAKLLIDQLDTKTLNSQDHTGATALHYAAQFDLPGTMIQLLEKGADPFIRNNHGESSFDIAMGLRSDCTALLLFTHCLQKHQDKLALIPVEKLSLEILNSVNGEGKTLLHLACEQNLQPLIQKLLAQGVDIRIPDKKGVSPIGAAIAEKKFDIACRMIASLITTKTQKLERHAIPLIEQLTADTLNTQRVDQELNTLLHLAAEHGCNDGVKALLGKGMNPTVRNKFGLSAFDVAFLHAAPATMSIFVAHMQLAELTAKNESGISALHGILLYGDEELQAVAASKGVDFSEVQFTPQMAIDLVCNPSEHLRANKIAEKFVAKLKKRDLDYQDKQGKTILHHAMEKGQFTLATSLIQRGASLLLADNMGKYPLLLDATFLPKNMPKEIYVEVLTTIWNLAFKQYGLTNFIDVVRPTLYKDSRAAQTAEPLVLLEITAPVGEPEKFQDILLNAQNQKDFTPLLLPILLQSENLKNQFKKVLSKATYRALAKEAVMASSQTAKQAEELTRFMLTELDPTHFPKTQSLQLVVYPNAKKETSLDSLITLFDTINFGNPGDVATYVSPERLGVITRDVFSKEQLRANLVRLVDVITNRRSMTAAPLDPKEREAFWIKQENICKLIIEKLQEKFMKLPVTAENQMQMTQVILNLATAGYYCAARYRGEFAQAYDLLEDNAPIRNVQEQTYDFLNQLKYGAINALLSRVDNAAMQQHIYLALVSLFSKEYGIPEKGTDEYADQTLAEWRAETARAQQSVTRFRSFLDMNYSVQAIETALTEHIKRAPNFKELVYKKLLEARPKGFGRFQKMAEKIGALQLNPFTYNLTDIPADLQAELEKLEIPKEFYPISTTTLLQKLRDTFTIELTEKIRDLIKKVLDEKVAVEKLPEELQTAMALYTAQLELKKPAPLARDAAASFVAKEMAKKAFTGVIVVFPDDFNGKSFREFFIQDLAKHLPEVEHRNLDWTVTDAPVTKVALRNLVGNNENLRATWNDTFQGQLHYEHLAQLKAKSEREVAREFLTHMQIFRTVQ